MNRIAVVGAGAMGSYFAACLAEAGNQVTVVDVDPARLELIGRAGIEVRDDRGDRAIRVAASTAADASGPFDFLIVFTKGMHTAAAAASARHLAGPQTLVLTLQNGLGNDEVLAREYGPDRLVIGMTDVPVDLVGPNCVASHGQATVTIGDYAPGQVKQARVVADALSKAGFKVKVDGEVRTRIWEKVAFNAAMNAMSAVTGLAVGGLDTEPGRRLIDQATAEVADVATAAGIVVDRERIAQTVRNALDHHTHHKPSMLQDMLAGRNTEVENINGAVVRKGEALGVATPVNAVLADLIRMIEGALTSA